MMEKLIGKLGGRKWLVALISIVLTGLNNVIGLDLSDKAIASIAGVAAALAIGQGLADGLSNGKTSTVVEVEK